MSDQLYAVGAAVSSGSDPHTCSRNLMLPLAKPKSKCLCEEDDAALQLVNARLCNRLYAPEKGQSGHSTSARPFECAYTGPMGYGETALKTLTIH